MAKSPKYVETIKKLKAERECPTGFDITQYDMTNPGLLLQQLFVDYEALATKVNESAESSSKIKERLKKEWNAQYAAESRVATELLQSLLLEWIVDNPGFAVVLHDVMKDGVKYVKEWSDVQLTTGAREERLSAQIDEELMEEAENYKTRIKTAWAMVEMNGDSPSDLIPTKTHGKEGNIVADTQRLTGDTSNLGRGAKQSQYVISVEGIDPAVTQDLHPQECIMIYVGSWNAFLDHLKANDIKFSGEPWTTEYNGKKIHARIPSNDPESDDS